MRLVITEKPSVARDLGRVLHAQERREGWLQGEEIAITWCVGHLVELVEPAHYDLAWKRWSLDTLPMLPERFALQVRDDAEKQFGVVQRLLNDPRFTDVVNGCDAGREGELIFRYVAELSGYTGPVQRLWLKSLTESAIQQAWGNLRPGSDFEALHDAARCRSEADWLVGLNATRAMTCLSRLGGGGRVLSVGRVQTPTLAMVVGRDAEIAAFVPEPTYQLRASFSADAAGGPAQWEGTWFRPSSSADTQRGQKQDAPVAERLPSEEVAQALQAAVQGQTGRVETSERQRVVDRPPLLYDLTSLQQQANRRYGLSAQRTLEVAQKLYEAHKLITYPRTDARHLTPDQVPELPQIAAGLGRMSVYSGFASSVIARFDDGFSPSRRVVDAGEVGDHHAILPTGKDASRMGLQPDEKRVFDLVARRFLAALSPDALFDKTSLVVAVQVDAPEPLPSPPRFRARGRVCVQAGWRDVDPPKKSKELELPLVQEGADALVESTEVLQGQTRPPRHMNDATLLGAMETAGKNLDDAALRRAMRSSGLGTPATRAAILQTLLNRGFIRREARNLRATERGAALIGAIPADELKSAELTGQWERRLTEMAAGKASRSDFMRDVAEHVAELVERIRSGEPPSHPAFAGEEPDGRPVGACPRCGGAVQERVPVFACSGCDFVIFKTMSGRAISRRMAGTLLKTGQTEAVKGFRSKRTGKAFSAALKIGEDGSVGLLFPESKTVAGCPRCSGQVRERGKVFACDSPECNLHIFRTMSGLVIDEAMVKTLLEHGRTPVMQGFVSRRTGKAFSAGLVINEDGSTGLYFEDQPTPSAPATGPMPTESADPAGLTCPECRQGVLLRGRTAWGCDRWKEGCRWTLRYDAVGSPQEAVERIRQR
ncbi:MAG: DNA topoisomerase 3 [Myxococcota bacterium]